MSPEHRRPRAKDRRPEHAGGPEGFGPPSRELVRTLERLREVLDSVGHPRATEVSAVLGLARQDPPAFWRAIDSNAWWAGVGSLAAETLGDNPGLTQAQWGEAVRELRERLIEIGAALLLRHPHNPGIPSWVLAFRNWNDSQV